MNDAILSLAQSTLQRWYHGDPWSFAEISDPAVTVVDPNLVKPVIGLDRYKIYLKQFEETIPAQTAEIINPCIQVHGAVTVLTYQYHSTGEWSGAAQVGWNVTEVYLSAGGEWKLVHRHRAYLRHQRPDVVEIPLPVSVAPQTYDGVLGDVMALEAAAMERWRKGDPWGFIEISDRTVTYFDTGTPQIINGLEALRAEYATREGKIFYDVSDFIDPHVQVYGDVAVLVYRFLSTELNPDGTISTRMPWNCTEVYARIDSQWKIVHTHWSFINGQPIG